MSSLSDQIDRLSHNTRAIKATTAHAAAPVGGPFTNAILSTSLGDLIRDIDPSELGLFSLPESEITRAEFTGATPLKKAPSRRDDAHKARDIGPEVYAQAALKCIDRYNAIRPMPRAHVQVEAILERAILVRESIQSLTETLQQVQAVEGPSLKSLIQEEEERVRDLQSRLVALEERKRNLSVTKVAASKPKHPHFDPEPKSKPPPRPSSPEEDNFWNTPAGAARTLRFSENLMEADNLLNEQVDLVDTSNVSFTSPVPASRTGQASALYPDDSIQFTPSLLKPPIAEASQQDNDESFSLPAEDDIHEPEYEDEGVGDSTVVLKKPSEQDIPTSPHQPDVENTPSVKKQKIRVNGEVELIANTYQSVKQAKIWTTIGDSIMPIQGQTSIKPPSAKEIMCVTPVFLLRLIIHYYFINQQHTTPILVHVVSFADIAISFQRLLDVSSNINTHFTADIDCAPTHFFAAQPTSIFTSAKQSERPVG
ncbi:hypothetical protein H0H92_004226 [Tricholoma furcatifolium]|nr:hypothetical protein H0H92_004226 [Tricholoma furcatifolium]